VIALVAADEAALTVPILRLAVVALSASEVAADAGTSVVDAFGRIVRNLRPINGVP
jgi:hypothetical protein